MIFSSITGVTDLLHDMCSCYSHSVQTGVEGGKGGVREERRGQRSEEKGEKRRRGGEGEVG